MTVRRLIVGVAVAAAAATGLSACSDNGPQPGLSTTPSGPSSPTFSTTPTPSTTPTAPTPEERNLRGAEEAVVNFWVMIDSLAAHPSVSLNRLAMVAEGQAQDQWLNNLSAQRVRGWRQIGTTMVMRPDA